MLRELSTAVREPIAMLVFNIKLQVLAALGVSKRKLRTSTFTSEKNNTHLYNNNPDIHANYKYIKSGNYCLVHTNNVTCKNMHGHNQASVHTVQHTCSAR